MAESLTHWRKLTDPNYLGAWDITPGVDLVLTIKKVNFQKVMSPEGNSETKPVLLFEEDYKPMVLGAKVNYRAIEKATGSPYYEQWQGKQIAIYTEHGKWFGKEQDALRIRPEAPALTKCADCGKTIGGYGKMSAKQVIQMTTAKYGRCLCAECGKKAKDALNEE